MAKRIKVTATSLILLLVFVVGAVVGVLTFKHITRNDEFVLNGAKEIALTVGDTYTEHGAKCVSFGKDVSTKIQIKGTVDTSVEGVYRLVYTIDDFRFGNIKRVRLITVSAEEVA